MLFINYDEHHYARFGTALNVLIKRAWTHEIRHLLVRDVLFEERVDLTIVKTAKVYIRSHGFEIGSLISPNMPHWKLYFATPRDLFDASLEVMANAPSILSERDKKLLTKAIIDTPSTVTLERARLLPPDILDRVMQWKALGCVVHTAPSTKLGAS